MKLKKILLSISVLYLTFLRYSRATEHNNGEFYPQLDSSSYQNTSTNLETRHFPFHTAEDVDISKLTISRRIYNSSIALTIPFYSFKIPHLEDGGFILGQAIFGLFSWAIIALTFGMSFLFTGSVPSDSESRSFQRLSTFAKKSTFNFLGSDFSKSFGMDGMQCMQKVVCQAHRPQENRKYGIMATTIRTLFPAPENATIDMSPIQWAARAGKYRDEDCEKLFDCILDPLGSARYLTHWYAHNNDNARVLLQMIDFNSSLEQDANDFTSTTSTKL